MAKYSCLLDALQNRSGGNRSFAMPFFDCLEKSDADVTVAKPALFRVKQTVYSLAATVLGVVLSNVDVRHDQEYRFYTSYREYSGKSPGSRQPKQKVNIWQSSNG
jgi:hypothetical protein